MPPANTRGLVFTFCPHNSGLLYNSPVPLKWPCRMQSSLSKSIIYSSLQIIKSYYLRESWFLLPMIWHRMASDYLHTQYWAILYEGPACDWIIKSTSQIPWGNVVYMWYNSTYMINIALPYWIHLTFAKLFSTVFAGDSYSHLTIFVAHIHLDF